MYTLINLVNKEIIFSDSFVYKSLWKMF